MKRILFLAATLSLFGGAALAQNLTPTRNDSGGAAVRANACLAADGSTVACNIQAVTVVDQTGAAASSGGGTDPRVAQGSTTSGQTGSLVQCAVTAASPTYTTATTNPLNCTTAGAQRVDGSAVTQPVSGTFLTPTAPGTATATTGMLNGCAYMTTLPTFTNTQQGAVQCDSRGRYEVVLSDTSHNPVGVNSGSTSSANSTYALVTNSRNYNMITGGSSWVSTFGDNNGTYMVPAPTGTAATNTLTPTVTSAVASSLVLKASAGNLYSVSITSGASAGYLLLFNATTAPADGAVTPQACYVLAANTSLTVNTTSGAGLPERYTTGITAVFSTTGCFTKTASATAFITGKAQ